MALMRDAVRQVADEKMATFLQAKQYLLDHTDDFGNQMFKRSLQLAVHRTSDIAVNMARALPTRSIAMLAGTTMVGLLLDRRLTGD